MKLSGNPVLRTPKRYWARSRFDWSHARMRSGCNVSNVEQRTQGFHRPAIIRWYHTFLRDQSVNLGFKWMHAAQWRQSEDYEDIYNIQQWVKRVVSRLNPPPERTPGSTSYPEAAHCRSRCPPCCACAWNWDTELEMLHLLGRSRL